MFRPGAPVRTGRKKCRTAERRALEGGRSHGKTEPSHRTSMPPQVTALWRTWVYFALVLFKYSPGRPTRGAIRSKRTSPGLLPKHGMTGFSCRPPRRSCCPHGMGRGSLAPMPGATMPDRRKGSPGSAISCLTPGAPYFRQVKIPKRFIGRRIVGGKRSDHADLNTSWQIRKIRGGARALLKVAADIQLSPEGENQSGGPWRVGWDADHRCGGATEISDIWVDRSEQVLPLIIEAVTEVGRKRPRKHPGADQYSGDLPQGARSEAGFSRPIALRPASKFASRSRQRESPESINRCSRKDMDHGLFTVPSRFNAETSPQLPWARQHQNMITKPVPGPPGRAPRKLNTSCGPRAPGPGFLRGSLPFTWLKDTLDRGYLSRCWSPWKHFRRPLTDGRLPSEKSCFSFRRTRHSVDNRIA